MELDVLIMYAVVSFFYIISPGPAVFLALSNGMTRDMKVVAISSLGNIIGLFILSTISISGLGAVLMASANLFMMVKIVGALYLIYLGIKQFSSAKAAKFLKVDQHIQNHRTSWSFFMESFILAVTNPKPIIFFIAFFPQFMNLQTVIVPQFFTMTGIFMLISFLSLYGYGFISKSAKIWFANPMRMAWFHRVTGGLFIVMGIGLLQYKKVEAP
ncbi:MAG: LysE family translocator [Campylobacterota bacterium]|nr:LysE family translocator [Campylobacterota bacterium]